MEEAKRHRNEEIEATEKWLEDLSGKAKTDRHADVSSLRLAGTGKWFVAEVLQWLEQKKQKVLWATGMPGVGKTMLMSALIEHFLQANRDASIDSATPLPLSTPALNRTSPAKSENSVPQGDGQTNESSPGIFRSKYCIAYIYFAFDELNEQEPLAVYAQILRQVYPTIQSLIEPLRKLRIDCQNSTPKSLAPRLFDLIQKLPETVLLVLDALDDADPEVRKNLCSWIEAMRNTTPRLLIATRTDEQKPLAPNNNLETMIVEASHDDMELYATTRISTNAKIQKIISMDLSEGIAEWTRARVQEILKNAQKT